MKKLSVGQLDRASEILGNISVAWFSAGVIAPVITPHQYLSNLLFTSGTSIVMTILFAAFSLILAKEVKP